ncbi:putative calcium-dependent lipid binding protein [Trypanosoma vivax]|nr:putative calcium-dependent lipid binding protein [Trypanosoma vivax]
MDISQIMSFFAGPSLGPFPIATAVVALWVVLRCVYAVGFLLLLELCLVSSAVSYVLRRESRRKMITTHQIHLLPQDPKNVSKVMGENMPEWLKRPSGGVQWLNYMVSGMWKEIAAAAERDLRLFIEPMLDYYKPSVVQDIKLKQCLLGQQPFVINSIQNISDHSNKTVLDITLSWDSDMDICFRVQIPGPCINVHVRRFQIDLQIRLTLGPHVSRWPCFGTMGISIMKIWLLNFDLSAAGVSLDAVPAVGAFVDNFIRSTLVGMMQHPKKLVLPILEGYTTEYSRTDAALGVLRVRLRAVKEWYHRYVSDRQRTPYYIKLLMSSDSDNKAPLKSKTYKGLDSELVDEFSFVLYDRKRILHFWLYFDIPGYDHLVGECDVPVVSLLGNEPIGFTCCMVRNAEPHVKVRAKLIISTVFKPYRHRNGSTAESVANTGTRPPDESVDALHGNLSASAHPPSSMVSKNIAGSQKPSECDGILAPGASSTVSNAHGVDDAGGWTLFITIFQCNGLKNMETFGTSDPYVVLRLKEQVCKSPYISCTLDPVFNFEAEMQVYDTSSDILRIAIVDKNDLSKDAVMGKVSIPLKQVASAPGHNLHRKVNLEPQGTALIQLKLLRF